MEDGKKMNNVLDFLISPYFSIILLLGGMILWKKRGKKSFFYLYHIITFGLLKWINSEILLPIFGCGCVPITQTNKLNIPMNTNHVTGLYFLISNGILFYKAYQYSKNMSKKEQNLFLISFVLLNLLVSYFIIKALQWQ